MLNYQRVHLYILELPRNASIQLPFASRVQQLCFPSHDKSPGFVGILLAKTSHHPSSYHSLLSLPLPHAAPGHRSLPAAGASWPLWRVGISTTHGTFGFTWLNRSPGLSEILVTRDVAKLCDLEDKNVDPLNISKPETSSKSLRRMLQLANTLW
jgi:hypothetical protein